VELLGDVNLPRVDVHRDRRDPREVEQVAAGQALRRASHPVAEPHVDTEAGAVDLARERRIHAEAHALVDDTFSLDRRMPRIGLDGEGEEVAVERELTGLAQLSEQVARVPRHPQVEVAGRSGALNAELERGAALEDDAVAEAGGDAREETLEDGPLTETPEILARVLRAPLEAILERVLERPWRLVTANRHAAPLRTSGGSWSSVNIPSRRPSAMACSIRSGER